MKSCRVVLPCRGKATDHDIESIIVGLRDLGKEKRSVGEVLEVNDFGEKEIWFLNGIDEHLGVDLL